MSLPPLRRLLYAAFLALGLGGCDNFGLQQLKPGITTAQEVRERLGAPSMEWRNDDGSVTWEYPKGPQGVETYMVTIGTNQLFQGYEQVLNEANYVLIQPGMDEARVRRILGKPAQVTTYPRKPETVWDWRIAGAMPSEEAHFHVHFGPDGKVTGTSRRVEPKG